jgi:Fe-S-cluster-containing hydrogenase component 2
MRVLFYDPELCVTCRTCEEVCSDTFFKEVSAERSRIRIYGTEGATRAAFCNQCGECVEVCPTEALYRDRRGVVRLRQGLCVGCNTCVGFCPYIVMYWHPDQIVPFKCISCGVCAQECPEGALEILEVEEPMPPAGLGPITT